MLTHCLTFHLVHNIAGMVTSGTDHIAFNDLWTWMIRKTITHNRKPFPRPAVLSHPSLPTYVTQHQDQCIIGAWVEEDWFSHTNLCWFSRKMVPQVGIGRLLWLIAYLLIPLSQLANFPHAPVQLWAGQLWQWCCSFGTDDFSSGMSRSPQLGHVL